MGKRLEQTFLQRRYADGQPVHEKKFNITDYQRNENENYNDIDAGYTGDGYFIIPLSYFDFDTNTLQASEFESNPTNFMKTLEILMKEYASIKVYAQPKQDEFEPENPNDIIYIDEDDIKVETTVKY